MWKKVSSLVILARVVTRQTIKLQEIDVLTRSLLPSKRQFSEFCVVVIFPTHHIDRKLRFCVVGSSSLQCPLYASQTHVTHMYLIRN